MVVKSSQATTSGRKCGNGKTISRMNKRELLEFLQGTGNQRAQTVAGQLFGDQGPGYFVRMILPPNSLSNVLTVRCNLDADPGQRA